MGWPCLYGDSPFSLVNTDRRSSSSVMGLAVADTSACMRSLRWYVNSGLATRFAYQLRLPGEPVSMTLPSK